MLAVGVLTGSVAAISSAQSLQVGAFQGVSNTEFNQYSVYQLDGGFANGGTISSSWSGTFDGFDGDFNTDTMTYSGGSQATAQYGYLRSSAWSTLDNSFYNSENPWYYNPTTGDVNPDGTPDWFFSVGQSRYEDVFTYTNIPAQVQVDFWFHVSGTFNGDGYHSIYVTADGDSDNLFLTGFDGSVINQTWVTKKFVVGADQMLNHSTTILSQVDYQTQFNPEHANLSGNVDFDSTVYMSAMHVYDMDGNLLTDWTMTSASGTTYPVPEPATLIGLATLSGLALRRKAKNKKS
ncbi:MAG: PEP-CTERM sorting domain-containing protein [Armatimonadetes bacterium]|nr:PEP-CTERM sorting domain-containing protein [Armatimonadota bacterium]